MSLQQLQQLQQQCERLPLDIKVYIISRDSLLLFRNFYLSKEFYTRAQFHLYHYFGAKRVSSREAGRYLLEVKPEIELGSSYFWFFRKGKPHRPFISRYWGTLWVYNFSSDMISYEVIKLPKVKWVDLGTLYQIASRCTCSKFNPKYASSNILFYLKYLEENLEKTVLNGDPILDKIAYQMGLYSYLSVSAILLGIRAESEFEGVDVSPGGVELPQNQEYYSNKRIWLEVRVQRLLQELREYFSSR